MSLQTDTHDTFYNNLPNIGEATNMLRHDLKADTSVSNDNLILPILQDPDVCALFRDGTPGENEGGLFGIWLVHKHYSLNPGECMVSSADNIAQPMPFDSTFYADRWDNNGREVEFVQPEAGSHPSVKVPSVAFFNAFQELVSTKFGVSGLGVCIRVPEATGGLIYIEETVDETRKQILRLVRRDSISTPPPGYLLYQAAWSAGALEPVTSTWECCTSLCWLCP